jgi:hypothetical protein
LSMAKQDGSQCPPLTCFSACRSGNKRLIELLSDQAVGCIDFGPDAVPAVVTRPCGSAHPKCGPGQVVHNRKCVEKKTAQHPQWDFAAFRSRLIGTFAREARPSSERCLTPRIALMGLWDYNPAKDAHFGDPALLREFYDLCVATLTWQVPLSVARFPAESSSWLDRPIAVPDAYFLATGGYTRLPLNFAKASINVTKAAILEANAKTPWERKHRSVVWRGTLTSDVSDDRKHLINASATAVAQGTFSTNEINIRSSEKYFDRPEDANEKEPGHFAAHMAISDMIQARGVFSVDGIGNEWTLPWKLLANSVTLLVESRRTWEWYYPRLHPWVHYVPVRNDLSDFADRVAFVLDPANDAKLRRIADQSTRLMLNMDIASTAGEVRVALERTFACA